MKTFLVSAFLTSTAIASWVDPAVLDACAGYHAQDVKTTGSGLIADLVIAGTGCAVFGPDIQTLTLQVVYETPTRIHVKITDKTSKRYEVPEYVLPRPKTGQVSSNAAKIQFNYTTNPFSFSIYRTSTQEVLFSTTSHPIIFEPQYLRVKTNLPTNANIYGLGEHTNPFRLPTSNTTLTLWSRDAFTVPVGSNLYGSHPIYFEHRTTGTHGVFLLNSNGMDIKLNDTNGATTLEYNIIGGVLDFYFLAGSETDPTEVARQYAEIVGTPAEVPYWSFGLHQCRWGYQNYIDVAGVISNYSAAGIPLQTMWTDIDYMNRRQIFTVDPQYFPMDRMREIVSYLHSHHQNFVLMTDPALLYQEGYGPYDRGSALDVFLKMPDGSPSIGLVWPGVTVFPDWFHPSVQKFWSTEFEIFYSPTDGLDIDGAWIDMNEPSNFCNLPCTDPFEQAEEQDLPPARSSPPPDPNAPIFVNSTSTISIQKRDDVFNLPYAINNATPDGQCKLAWTNSTYATHGFCSTEFQMFYSTSDGLDNDGEWIDMNEPSNFSNLPCTDPSEQAKGQDLPKARSSPPPDPNAPIFFNSTSTISMQKRDDVLNPPYAINNAAPGGELSSKTAWTNSTHANGLLEYDTHNLYGTMMSTATRNAMLNRRPGLKTLVITRSSFAGAGKHVGKWLGDNVSAWVDYRLSIAGILGMAGIYQVPMVGADICGFAGNTTETLCARWAMLGAFYPFMRNHNIDDADSQEFYRWESVTQAAKNALDIRYRLIDYLYTAFHSAHTTGTPVIQPLWFHYPKDESTFPIDLQFFFGSSILISPVTEENSTSVTAYFPHDIFYDFIGLLPFQGEGQAVTMDNVSFTQIPVHIRGGVVLPLRLESAMTTDELRKKDFEFIVAPGMDGQASGTLYVDDGVSIVSASSTLVSMRYAGQTLVVEGSFGFATGVKVEQVKFLSVKTEPSFALVDAQKADFEYDKDSNVLVVHVGLPLSHGFVASYH